MKMKALEQLFPENNIWKNINTLTLSCFDLLRLEHHHHNMKIFGLFFIFIHPLPWMYENTVFSNRINVCSQPTYSVRHLETKYEEHQDQPVEPFRQKPIRCQTRQSVSKSCVCPLQSVTVEELVLLCATDIVSCQQCVRFAEADGLSRRSLQSLALN